MAKMSRRAAVLGLSGIALAGIGVAGYGIAKTTTSDSAPEPTPPVPTQTPEPTTTPAAPVDNRPRWPLTGVLLKDAKDAQHAAVAVKVPDNKYEHPQRGIDEADIVFVELDGYRDSSGHSGTRLMPVYHSKMAKTVEPVRSIRPVDIPLLSPINAVIGNTGAAPWVINYVKHYRQHLEGMKSYMATKGTGSYGTDQSRVYQLNGQTYYDRATVCHPNVLTKQVKRFKDGPPQPYFPWVTKYDEVSTTGGRKATVIKVPYKGDEYLMTYTYSKKRKKYLRSMPWGPHVMADGTRIAADNVLIIKSKQRYGKIFHGKGHDEPLYAIINGQGTFYYAHQGKIVTGTWRKGKVNDTFTFTLSDGTPLKMAPGKTWVELPNKNAKITIKA